MLKAVSAAFKAQIRPTDILGRMGGEEFLLLLPEISLENATLHAERLRQSVQSLTVEHAAKTIRVTCSFGVASVPPGTASLEATLLHVDKLLYAAKQGGRNCVVSGATSAESPGPNPRPRDSANPLSALAVEEPA